MDSQETIQRIDRFVQSVNHVGMDLVRETEFEQGCEPGATFPFFTPNVSTNQLASNYYEHKIQSCRSNVNLYSEGDIHLRKRIKHFVASKADLIFKLKGKEKWKSGIDYNADSSLEAYKLFATQIPALETEMQMSPVFKRAHMFQVLKVGDIVVGNVSGKRPFGVFVRITSLIHGRNLDFSDIDIQALCHKSELDHKSREHLDPIDDFEINDDVQGVICSVSVEEEKIAISFRSSKLPSEYGNIELGIIEDIDEHAGRVLPSFEEDRDYNDYLAKDPGFSNPTNVQTLINVLGINIKPPYSLLRSCQQLLYDGQEDAISLRKKQSMKWSMDTTATGVENFKSGSHDKAMKCFNHALQVYEENAEALVARGALYANQNKLENAIKDFRAALQAHPNHHNAHKYLKETLFEKAVRIKKIGNIKEGIDIFQEILTLDPHHTESQDHLEELQSLMAAKCEEERRKQRKESAKESTNRKFEHVRKLIKADPDLVKTSRKKRKKKKKRKDTRHKKYSQKKVFDESTSTASEGADYSEGGEWVEIDVDRKLGPTSRENTEGQPKVKVSLYGQQSDERLGDRGNIVAYSLKADKPVFDEGKSSESLKIQERSMKRENERKSRSNSNEKGDRKSLNEILPRHSDQTNETKSDFNLDMRRESRGSRSRSNDSRSRSRSSRRRVRDSPRRGRGSRSKSRSSRSSGSRSSSRGSRRSNSSSTSKRIISRDRGSTIGKRGSSRSTSRDGRVRRGSGGVSRSTSGSGGSSRTSRNKTRRSRERSRTEKSKE